MTSPHYTLPATPWYCSHTPAGQDGDALSSVHQAGGRLIAIVQPGPAATGELLTLAPDMLTHLVALVSAICRIDPEYCADTQQPLATSDDLVAALDDAITLIRHARELGIPIPEVQP